MNLGLALVASALIVAGALIVHGGDQTGGVLIGASMIFVIWGTLVT